MFLFDGEKNLKALQIEQDDVIEVYKVQTREQYVHCTINIFAYFCFNISMTILKYEHIFQIYISILLENMLQVFKNATARIAHNCFG